MRERESVEREGVCESGSGLLGGVEVVRSESWRMERRDRKASILSDVAACARERL